MAIGIFHVGVTFALFVWEPTFWIASNNADQVIHATYAIGGIMSALGTPPAGRTPSLDG